jgi:hypothetical protein
LKYRNTLDSWQSAYVYRMGEYRGNGAIPTWSLGNDFDFEVVICFVRAIDVDPVAAGWPLT